MGSVASSLVGNAMNSIEYCAAFPREDRVLLPRSSR